MRLLIKKLTVVTAFLSIAAAPAYAERLAEVESPIFTQSTDAWTRLSDEFFTLKDEYPFGPEMENQLLEAKYAFACEGANKGETSQYFRVDVTRSKSGVGFRFDWEPEIDLNFGTFRHDLPERFGVVITRKNGVNLHSPFFLICRLMKGVV